MAFESTASNLVPNDTGASDIFVVDLADLLADTMPPEIACALEPTETEPHIGMEEMSMVS